MIDQHFHAVRELKDREEAALRRVTSAMRAEAAELPPESWVRLRLEQGPLADWGESLLDDLAALMRAESAGGDGSFFVPRPRACPLDEREEASLRRLATLLRAEAAELDSLSSAVGRRLYGLGVRLALECEHPLRMRVP